jgi:hypothetical protein
MRPPTIGTVLRNMELTEALCGETRVTGGLTA